MVVPVVIATLALGIPLDALGPWWGQPVVNLMAWLALGLVLAQSTPEHRRSLVVCVLIATLGELFLGFVWGLYVYRLGNLPLFIPAGHALVFAAGVRMSRRAPPWLPMAVVVGAFVWVSYAAWTGIDTSAALWFGLFLLCLRLGRDRALYATMFLFALVIELYGTGLGGWRYHPVLPHTGLTSTNPPACAGVFYCVLDLLVLRLGGRSAPVSVGGA